MVTKLTPNEARQGGGSRATLWVLTVSVALAMTAGLLLAFSWISLP